MTDNPEVLRHMHVKLLQYVAGDYDTDSDWIRDMARDLQQTADELELGEIDEDPLPLGYALHVYPKNVEARKNVPGYDHDENIGPRFATYKAAVRWCWAHSQGLVAR